MLKKYRKLAGTVIALWILSILCKLWFYIKFLEKTKKNQRKQPLFIIRK